MFEIGQKVKWTIGNFLIQGCVLEDNGNEKVKVVSHFRNELPHVQQMDVIRELLTKNDSV